jgi:ParB family chromosome partitioning protein
MGKRVNLAELALETVPDTYSPSPRMRTVAVAEPATSAAPAAAADRSALPVSEIAANPLNRRAADDTRGEDFAELVETIRRHGVLQPIVVCSAVAFLDRYPQQRGAVAGASWVALIGNRRLAAAAAAGSSMIPALINDDRVNSMYEVMLVENSHRKDLGPIHEAEAMQQVLDHDGCSRRELAGRIGRTHTYVNQRLALLGLIAPLRAALESGSLKIELAREFGGLPATEQEEIAAAGPPYRRPTPGPAYSSRPARRTIAASSPVAAADAIRRVFSPEECAELVRLLQDAV